MDEIKELLVTYQYNGGSLYKYCLEYPHDDFMLEILRNAIINKSYFQDTIAKHELSDINSYLEFLFLHNDLVNLNPILSYAIETDRSDVVQFFIDNNYDFNMDFQNGSYTKPLSVIITRGKKEMTRMLLDSNTIKIVDNYFIAAFFSSNDSILSYLLEDIQMNSYFQEHKQSIFCDICKHKCDGTHFDCPWYYKKIKTRGGLTLYWSNTYSNHSSEDITVMEPFLNYDLLLRNIQLMMHHGLIIDLTKIEFFHLPFELVIFLIENSEPLDPDIIIQKIIDQNNTINLMTYHNDFMKQHNDQLCYQILEYYLTRSHVIDDSIKLKLIIHYPNTYSLLFKYQVDLSTVNDLVESSDCKSVVKLTDLGLTTDTLIYILQHQGKN